MKLLVFAWGLAEATFFFLVPDVALTFIAIRRLRTAVLASLATLAGALLGGAIMYFCAPENLLDYVPGIEYFGHSADQRISFGADRTPCG